LKGSLTQFAARGASLHAGRLEEAARRGDPALPRLAAEFVDEVAQFDGALRGFLATLDEKPSQLHAHGVSRAR
jgi:hypothetical protein